VQNGERDYFHVRFVTRYSGDEMDRYIQDYEKNTSRDGIHVSRTHAREALRRKTPTSQIEEVVSITMGNLDLQPDSSHMRYEVVFKDTLRDDQGKEYDAWLRLGSGINDHADAATLMPYCTLLP
jgi:hypothetical protein